MSLNTVLNTKFDIFRVLEELSKTNPLFNSELEFQFYLAWKIKELYKTDKEMLKKYTKILYDEARLIEGLPVSNPTELSSLVCELLSK